MNFTSWLKLRESRPRQGMSALLVLLTVGFSCASAQTVAADTGAIHISVFDAKTKQPIPKFRVIAGVPSSAGITPAEFKERTLQDAVNFQPHTMRDGENGRLQWPLDKAYEEMALRVEADGYKPKRSGWIKKADGPQPAVFPLEPDPGIDGRILQPDGKPAAGAVVAVALPQRDAVIEEGNLRHLDTPAPQRAADRWYRPVFAKSDTEGRFRIYTETDPASAILVVHESGVYELPTSEFQKHPELTLERWGRIEGQVLWKDKPGANEEIRLSIFRDEHGYPGMIAQYGHTTSDAEGRFQFDKVIPGTVQLSRDVEIPKGDDSGVTSVSFPGLVSHVTALPGERTRVTIGGQGRTVKGRFTGRDSWEGITFHFHPDAPHFGFRGDDISWKGFGIFRESAIGPLFFRGNLKPNSDGAFEIPHMLPGSYQFFVSSPGVENYAAYKKFRIDPETPGDTPALLDLGEIAVARGKKQ